MQVVRVACDSLTIINLEFKLSRGAGQKSDWQCKVLLINSLGLASQWISELATVGDVKCDGSLKGRLRTGSQSALNHIISKRINYQITVQIPGCHVHPPARFLSSAMPRLPSCTWIATW